MQTRATKELASLKFVSIGASLVLSWEPFAAKYKLLKSIASSALTSHKPRGPRKPERTSVYKLEM